MATTSAATRLTDLPRMTLEEFLAWDGGGHVGKLELWNGVVRALLPASATHAMIQTNIVVAVQNHLRARKSQCRAATEAPVVPPMGDRRNARAPDVTVTCAPPSDSPTLDDPILIVEVMSPGNENETWGSIQSLAGLTSLKEVLVVQLTEVRAEVYRRDASGAWPRHGENSIAGGSLHLASIDLTLDMIAIYEGTHLS